MKQFAIKVPNRWRRKIRNFLLWRSALVALLVAKLSANIFLLQPDGDEFFVRLEALKLKKNLSTTCNFF